MGSWIPNSSINARCCLGKIIDEVGVWCKSIIIGPRNRSISFQIREEFIEDFMSSPYYIHSALAKKSILRNGSAWFQFRWEPYFAELRGKGLC